MSNESSIWGIDIASWQAGVDLSEVRAEGFSFCVVKATEGPSADGWEYVNPYYEEQRSRAWTRAR